MSHHIIIAIAVCSSAILLLHFMSRLLLLSFHSRSKRLFGSSPWLPLRRGLPRVDGENVDFLSQDSVRLSGTYFKCKTMLCHGVIIYCHELNGTRWGVSSYLDSLLSSGFDVFAFDMRNHGESQSVSDLIPTPWVTKYDLTDVRAAIDFVTNRNHQTENLEIGLLGISKGATVAACMAGLDNRVASLVLDSPAPEGRLFERNCWTTLMKVNRRWGTIFSWRYATLFVKAIAFSLACPFIMAFAAWWRWIMGCWCGCKFISTRPLVRFAHQPIFIIHGNQDNYCRVDQIHAFCHRMPHRPSVWVVSNCSHGKIAENAGDEYEKKIVQFFKKTFTQNETAFRVDPAAKEKVPIFLRDMVQISDSLMTSK